MITCKVEFYSMEKRGFVKTEHIQDRLLSWKMVKTVSTQFFIFRASVPFIFWINFNVY